MNLYEFTATLVGHVLSWPVAIVALGFIFRRPLIKMLSRVSRITYRGGETELVALVESSEQLQETVEDAARPLPEDAAAQEEERRRRIERLVRDAAEWGWRLAGSEREFPTEPVIAWSGAEPELVPVVISPGDRLALAAMFHEFLSEPRPKRPHPSSYAGAAKRLKWPRTTLVKRIEYLRTRLTEAGVPGLTGWDALYELAEYVISTGILRPGDLDLLDNPDT